MFLFLQNHVSQKQKALMKGFFVKQEKKEPQVQVWQYNVLLYVTTRVIWAIGDVLLYVK